MVRWRTYVVVSFYTCIFVEMMVAKVKKIMATKMTKKIMATKMKKRRTMGIKKKISMIATLGLWGV